MPAQIDLFQDPDCTIPFDLISLHEVQLADSVGEGEPTTVYGKNTGTAILRNLFTKITGPGSGNVEIQAEGSATWTQGGENVILHDGTLLPDQVFSFSLRPTYRITDSEGDFPFDIVFSVTSLVS